jgi:hypothetical protein
MYPQCSRAFWGAPQARFVALLTAAWMLFVAAVYLPDVGRGFVKDDFGWVEMGRATLQRPADALLPQTPGFYRPLVTLSFAVDYLLHGVQPRGYGFTNLALYLACALALWTLCRALHLSPPGAAIAVLAWAANPHGINMALVWVSGRTSLCLTLFALLATIAMTRRRYVWAGLFLACALGSKEEALALPLILFAWHRLVSGDSTTRWFDWKLLAALTLPVAVYAETRLHTGALTPASAPAYYQFTFAPAIVFRNAIEYADRAATTPALIVVIAALVFPSRVARMAHRNGLLTACAIWFVGGFILTVFLPVRSSLYAVFPSVGAAIACALLVERLRRSALTEDPSLLRLGVVLAMTILAMVPIYRARNGRYVEPARLSERALRTIHTEALGVPPGGVIMLHDVSDPMSNFAGAFGTFATNAVRLRTGWEVQVWIDPPPGGWQLAGVRPPASDRAVISFVVDHGRISRTVQ